MPKGFDRCEKEGGRIRRIVPKKGTYINICYLNGKAHRGEVHHTNPKIDKLSDQRAKLRSKSKGYG